MLKWKFCSSAGFTHVGVAGNKQANRSLIQVAIPHKSCKTYFPKEIHIDPLPTTDFYALLQKWFQNWVAELLEGRQTEIYSVKPLK